MSPLVTKERAVREVTQFEANGRFKRAFGSAATGETIDFVPSGKAAGHLFRVLVVDDYRATADTLSSLVTVWGHDARCAYDGVSGVRLAAAFQPDVMLLDSLMPTVSGLEVVVQVRRQDPLKTLLHRRGHGAHRRKPSQPMLRGGGRLGVNQAGCSFAYANAAAVGIAARAITKQQQPTTSRHSQLVVISARGEQHWGMVRQGTVAH
jgi:CheY-like chemotaxis protein